MSHRTYLVSHQGTASSPSAGELAEAVRWAYSFTMATDGEVAFEVTWNELRTLSYGISLENADGVARLRATAAEGAAPALEIAGTSAMAVDGAYEFAREDGTRVSFEEASFSLVLDVVFKDLDIFDVQSARASIADNTFPEPLLPFIENDHRFVIGGAPATVVAHLTSLVQTLAGSSPFASQPMAIECRYAYAIGGVPVEAPVVLLARQEVPIGFHEELLGQMESAVVQWLDAVQPPLTGASLLFSLTLWSALPRTDARLLRLPNLLLPMMFVVRGGEAALT